MSRTSVLASATKVEPRAEDRSATEAVGDAAGSDVSRFVLRLPGGREVRLPEALVKVLLTSASELSNGHSVMVLPSETHLTPSEAGELLGLSRPFVSRLLDEGTLPFQNLPGSRHRVVRLEDVIEFQERRVKRAEGRRKIAEIVESEDLP